jgi:hypothetical protein
MAKKNDLDFNMEYSGLILAGKALHLAGDRKRYAQRRELLALRAKHIPITKNLKQLLQKMDDSSSSSSSATAFDKHMDIYREAVQQVFGDDEAGKEERAVQLQTKLCHALHCHEMQVKQIHSLKRHHKHLVNHLLKKELREQEEGKTEIDPLKSIAKLEEERRRLKEESEMRLKEQQEEMDALKQVLGEQNLLTPQISGVGSFDGDASSLGYRIQNGETAEDMRTPKILQQSKIWVDLMEAEEKDADALWEARKGANNLAGGSNHFRRSSSVNPTAMTLSNHNKIMSPTQDRNSSGSLPMFGSPLHHAREVVGAARQSIIGSILGGIWDVDEDGDGDDDGFACVSPQPTKKKFASNAVAAFLTGVDAEEPLSPTSAAIRELADEVFSF